MQQILDADKISPLLQFTLKHIELQKIQINKHKEIYYKSLSNHHRTD